MSEPSSPSSTSEALTLVQAMKEIEDAAGGRLELAATLEAAPGAEFELLAGYLADPANDGLSLAALCRKAGLSMRDFLTSLRDARYARLAAEIGLKVAQHLPKVAEDIVLRAQPHYVECPGCAGSGVAPVFPAPSSSSSGGSGSDAAENADQPPAPPPCSLCKGSGQQLVLPELARQKLALELGGVLKQGPGVAVGVVVNNPGPTLPELPRSTPAFRRKTDELVWEAPGHAPGRTVDVEATVVDDPGEDSEDAR